MDDGARSLLPSAVTLDFLLHPRYCYGMTTYEFRCDFADGFEIAAVVAGTLDAALATVRQQNSDALNVTCVGSISRTPQQALIFG